MRHRTARIAPHLRHWTTLTLLLGAASVASAQWAWRDDHGVTVYSDQPPPSTIKASDVLRQPEPAPMNPDSANAEAQSASNPAAAPPPAPNVATPAAPKVPTTAERELEFRKRMKERADAEKKLADAQAEATRKAEDCERARAYLQSLESEIRLVRTNPDGSRELMDADQRQTETQRTRESIESHCN